MKKNPLSAAIHELYRKALKHTKYRWLVIFGTLLYIASPLDISPDVFPVIGWIDDGLIASLLITEVSQLMTQQLMTQRLKDKRQTLETLTTEPFDAKEDVPTITVNAVTVG